MHNNVYNNKKVCAVLCGLLNKLIISLLILIYTCREDTCSMYWWC